MKYEWNPQKNWENIHKHGISFETATHVFDDEYAIYLYDEAHSITEDRYIAIGYVNNVMVVVHTEKAHSTRIISARYATAAERAYYYERRNSLL